MTQKISRAEYLRAHQRVRAWAELDRATNLENIVTAGPMQLEKSSFQGKRALILGAGVGGPTTAYELLVHEAGMEVTILEAQNRSGGRCLSLRTGDTLTEDEDSKLFGFVPGETQEVRFKQPAGDSAPYLNAGSGRIPSAHKMGIDYAFGDSDYTQSATGPYRRP